MWKKFWLKKIVDENFQNVEKSIQKILIQKNVDPKIFWIVFFLSIYFFGKVVEKKSGHQDRSKISPSRLGALSAYENHSGKSYTQIQLTVFFIIKKNGYVVLKVPPLKQFSLSNNRSQWSTIKH